MCLYDCVLHEDILYIQSDREEGTQYATITQKSTRDVIVWGCAMCMQGQEVRAPLYSLQDSRGGCGVSADLQGGT